MSFKTKNYQIIKQIISEDLTDFIYKYFLLKRQVANTLFKSNYISPSETIFGTWNDAQVPNTYSNYADMVMETLLCKIHPIMEEITNLKLTPNYSYARIYKEGDILKKHTDRFSCEISTTLNLGGNHWSIFLKQNNKKIKVDLKPGDMLVYKGNMLEHWREKFKGDHCAQVFLHYNNINTKGATENLFDKRIHLGLPSSFKKV
jgi:hypothetical protein